MMTQTIDQSTNQSTNQSTSNQSQINNSAPVKFSIRQFTRDDQDVAVKIFYSCQMEFALSPEYADHALQHDMADIESHYVKAARSNFWCAVDDSNNEVIGIVGVRPMQKADPDYYNEVKGYTDQSLVAFDPDNCAELNRMAVIPRVRRSGVARALLNNLVDWCANNGYPHVHLTTLVTMRHAFNFYLRCGWNNYRILRACYENDPRMQNQAMVERNKQLRAAGQGHLLEYKFSVPVEEVPLDEQEVQNATISGILWVSHFYTSTSKQSSTN